MILFSGSYALLDAHVASLDLFNISPRLLTAHRLKHVIDALLKSLLAAVLRLLTLGAFLNFRLLS